MNMRGFKVYTYNLEIEIEIEIEIEGFKIELGIEKTGYKK